MKKYLILSLMLISAITVFAQTPNFTGKWLLNKSKTDFGQAPEFVLVRSYTVSSTEKAITIERIALDPQMVEHPATDTLSFDGKEASSTTYSGSKRTASFKWNDDKKSFTILSNSINKEGNPGAKVTDIWSLSPDNKTLTVERTVVNADGSSYPIKGIYDKQ